MLANDATSKKIEKKIHCFLVQTLFFFKNLKIHICDAAELAIIHNTV